MQQIAKSLSIAVAVIGSLFGGCFATGGAARKPVHCPPPGTAVPLEKVMNNSFLEQYQGCDIVVEAEFMKVGTGGMIPIAYDASENTTFTITTPIATAPGGDGSQRSAYIAGTPKAGADILFKLALGSPILLRGAPQGAYARGRLFGGVFHATQVTLKPAQ